ncbi:unnamed protein product [Coffea canephora]|uniref:DNA-directed RNA polymerase subunit n=1 Tax=Coffea canephora TaxID=49390 RepID=A0A068UP97_COFCA|nr:unnamed protein product [Coffea canephora]
MAQTTEGGASEAVEKVLFSFMTSEEVRKHSVVKIKNPVLLDTVGRPMPGGLYDPAMGPFDEQSPCKSCGQRSFHCTGHCGHIELVSPAYNPLLFNMLYNLLQRTCFYCFHFRSSTEEVDKCVLQLERIAKGDVIGAKRLDAASSADLDNSEDSEGSHVSCGNVYHGAEEHMKQPSWDSFQFTEAMSVLNMFLKPKLSKCGKCEAKNPKIKKPTFGWFHMVVSNAETRANIIRGHRLDGFRSGGSEERSSSEVVNANDSLWEDDSQTGKTASYTVSDGIDTPVAKKSPNQPGRVGEELKKQKEAFSEHLLPSEVRDVVKRLWENEAPLCSFICDLQREQHNSAAGIAGYSMFFLDSILVPPIKFRPLARTGDAVMEHPHTNLLSKVLQSNIALGNAYINNAERYKIVNRWMDLQQSISVLYDSKTTTGQSQKAGPVGICQLLEKKEGIFRQKMMGKRVNFACRSVISPDPYLAVNEIGVPPYFALRLTYPERVTPWNVGKLRGAIVNGPEIHPGALSYTDKVSTVKLPSSKKMRIAISRKLPSSRGVVTQLGKNSEHEFEGKVVYRHLQDGDVVLVNRQPTLHKPSIMAHVVRVLKGEKTLRMHYANCSSYNADFDGDEMNVHFPQDEISRAEAYNIVNANEQYIVPTRGDTVRGLIQDHIGSAVLLTMKDTFLTYDEFNQLLYGSGVFTTGSSCTFSNYSGKISIVDSEGIIQPILPAVLKPKPLWTGKQVITALLNQLTKGCAPCSIEKEMKIPKQYFPTETYEVQQSENDDKENDEKKADNCLLVWKNELVRGVIDKAQFGQFGLVHSIQELYGANTAGLLLSALSRLFTMFLQMHGFTCGVEDLIILPHFDLRRKEELEGEDVGEDVHCEFVNFKRGQIGPLELQLEIEKVICRDREAATASLDMKMKNKLTKKASQISKELLLKGLLKPFPKNCISLMTISGAKGSTVNFQQISSYLGQQELEGKRVPRMVSGKTLPCFPPWDFTSRAGGYITDRFLSGLRPQEYYFHCMAGREGLVDTAVKTSRSGYLQRCLIKNLESLKVCYDYTVRDADGSIVQFYYGEDGVDVHRTSFLKNLRALALNQVPVRQKYERERDFNAYIVELPDGLKRKAEGFLKGVNTDSHMDFMTLLAQKYLSSLAPSGEPVGVIAAQSVGEPSTQMTLNTFHLAGRGEMNVTLGIPRLQEILMTAAQVIKTPVMTCPFLQFKSMDDAKSLVAKVKKITVADIIESMEVHLLPLSVLNNGIGIIYKLMMTFKHHEFASSEDCKETLRHSFLRELEDAIQNHLVLLSRISGIKNIMSNTRSKGNETDEDASGVTSHEEGDDENDDGDGGKGNDDMAEDLGSDAQKRKQQATDEMDYEDITEDESTADHEQGKDGQSNDEGEIREGKEAMDVDDEHAIEMEHDNEEMSKPKSGNKNGKSTLKKRKKAEKKFVRKETDRNIFVEVEGQKFEAHFGFTNEPHILLAQIAQKTAKHVYIKSSGKINQCKMVEHDVSENTVIWDAKKVDKKIKAKKQMKANVDDLLPYWALKAAGVDFIPFWEMQDDLDTARIYSNSIHAMLETYGVEAARATIIREVTNVFGIYGVQIDYRHLSLIADYMTHSGGYRPMSRHGSIAESLSPLAKMSFETAGKFIVEAASHGMTDNLETPSSRICLGLPVKMGTGCFDLMQQLDTDINV